MGDLIWKERNTMIFNQKEDHVHQLLDKVRLLLFGGRKQIILVLFSTIITKPVAQPFVIYRFHLVCFFGIFFSVVVKIQY